MMMYPEEGGQARAPFTEFANRILASGELVSTAIREAEETGMPLDEDFIEHTADQLHIDSLLHHDPEYPEPGTAEFTPESAKSMVMLRVAGHEWFKSLLPPSK